jgi:hypothetical protein
MHVGDKATFHPGSACDSGEFAECNRAGCLAFVVENRVKTGPAGLVDLQILTRDGKIVYREAVPVFYQPEYDPPFPPDEVDPPHRTPYCRPAKP